jgi:hypothetical protein
MAPQGTEMGTYDSRKRHTIQKVAEDRECSEPVDVHSGATLFGEDLAGSTVGVSVHYMPFDWDRRLIQYATVPEYELSLRHWYWHRFLYIRSQHTWGEGECPAFSHLMDNPRNTAPAKVFLTKEEVS